MAGVGRRKVKKKYGENVDEVTSRGEVCGRKKFDAHRGWWRRKSWRAEVEWIGNVVEGGGCGNRGVEGEGSGMTGMHMKTKDEGKARW